MRRPGSDDGAIAIMVAVLAIALFGFGAIVVDLGMARTVKQESQDSADAAALAGADALYTGSSNPRVRRALKAIRRSARENFQVSSWSGCSAAPQPDGITVWDQGGSGTSCIQFGRRPGEPVTQVFVAMPPRHLDPVFGGIIQSNGVDVHGQAVAGTKMTAASQCGLCVFGQLAVLPGGGVEVHGGASLSSETGVVADATNTLVVSDGGKITFVEEPTPSSGPAYSPAPIWPWLFTSPLSTGPPPRGRGDTFPDPVTCDGSAPLARGTYTDITVTGNCTLKSGTSTVTGLLTISSGGALTGPDSTLLVTGNGSLSLAGVLDIGGSRDLSLYWASSQPLVLSGLLAKFGGDVYVSGSVPLSIASQTVIFNSDVYAKSATVTVSSPSPAVDGIMVTGSLNLSTGSRLSVTAGGAPVVKRGDLGLVQ